jgi:hypothetical protein
VAGGVGSGLAEIARVLMISRSQSTPPGTLIVSYLFFTVIFTAVRSVCSILRQLSLACGNRRTDEFRRGVAREILQSSPGWRGSK